MSKLTVLMTVYNGASFLKEAIKSILDQTYTDFKFLIIDNASTDDSREIVRSFNDPRIHLEALPENIGQIPALNKGLEMIDTPYIARMDADDISMPKRFELQIAFMESHPFVGICGSFVIAIRGKKEIPYIWPTQSDDIKVKLLFECTIPHPAVMLRTSFFKKYGLTYNETLGHSEDWELWQRGASYFELANIPEFLLKYRIHESNESFRILHRQREAAEQLDKESLKSLHLDNHPLNCIHRDVAFETFNVKNREPGFITDAVQWFRQLKQANHKYRIYDEEALNRFLKERLFIVVTFNTHNWRLAFTTFYKEKLYRYVPWMWVLKFWVKILRVIVDPRRLFSVQHTGKVQNK